MIMKNQAFLINTLTYWEEPPRARHQVARALSKNYSVVFVAANKIGFPTIRIQKINENFTLITPFFPLDMRIRYRIPVINEFFQHWLYRKLVKEYKHYKVINFDYTATQIFKYFNNVVYYCNDSFYEISKTINPIVIAKYHKRCEARVAAKSDFCVGISILIKDYLRKYNPNVIEIPLGSPDIEEYNIAVQEAPSRDKKIKVVLVAVIKKLNISYNVINLLLKDVSISLTLIGPIDDSFMKEIENKEKLIVKGSLFGKELYEEINKYDVAIAPYCTKSNNDIFTGTGGKLYHYLSVGKPIVISYMSGLNQLNLNDKIIYPAKEEEDFPVLVHKAHEDNTVDLIKQRMNYAKRNTWTNRMKDLITYYDKINNSESIEESIF